MTITIPQVFRDLCSTIIAENKPESEWALIESDDMFQFQGIEGGFDADEMAFCFSILVEGVEYWFQLTLVQIEAVCRNELNTIEVRRP